MIEKNQDNTKILIDVNSDRGIHDFSLQALSHISVPHYFLVIVYKGVDRGDKLQELLLLLHHPEPEP